MKLNAKQQALWDRAKGNTNVMEAASVWASIDDSNARRGVLFVNRDREQERQEAPVNPEDAFAAEIQRQMGMPNSQAVGNEGATTTPQSAAQTAPLTRGAESGAVEQGGDPSTPLRSAQDDSTNLNGGTNYANTQQGAGAAAAQPGADAGAGVLYGSGQRNDGAGTGQQAGSLGSRAGQDPARGSNWAVSRGEGIRRKNIINDLRRSSDPVSSKSQGIQTGTDNATMRIVPQEMHTEAMSAEAERIYQETGKRVTYVVGPLEVVGNDGNARTVRGVTTENGIFVRIDHTLPAEKIGKHESFHGMLDAWGAGVGRGTILEGIMEEIRKNYTPEEIRSVLTRYKEALRGVYSGSEAEVDQNTLEEMLADAYAGINAFGAGATKFSEAVQGFMRDNHMSRETVQDNGTEQPTGPPQQAGTLQESIEQQWSGEPAGQKENTADNGGERYSVDTTADGIKYVKLDGNIFLKEDGTEMSPREAYNRLVGTQIVLEDGDIITFVKNLPKRDMYSELFRKRPGYGTDVDVAVVNDAVNRNMPDVVSASVSKDRNVPQQHEHVGVVDFDQRYVYLYDGISAYKLDFWVANLTDGKKIAYVKKYIEKAAPNVESKIKKAETAGKHRLNRPSNISIRNEIENVKQQIQAVFDKVSPNHAEQMKRHTELKDSDPAAAQRFYDGLMESQYRAEFEEYLKLTEELAELEAKAGTVEDAASATEDAAGTAEDAGTGGNGAFTERTSLDDPGVDGDGNALSTAQADYFAESQARDNSGQLLILYHQTAGDFTIFDVRHPGAGSTDSGTPFGISLADYVAWQATTSGMKNVEKMEQLLSWDLSDEAKTAVVGSIFGTDMETESGSPTQYAKFLDALKDGLSVNEYLELYTDGVDIDGYLKYTDAGLNPDAAAEMSRAMYGLEQEAGEDPVPNVQKWRAAVDSQDGVEDQLAALSVVMSDSQYRKVRVANNYAIRPDAYVKVQELLPNYDADGNGSYKQTEVTAAINGISGSMGMTTQQKAALWQLVTGSTSAKNNPYDKGVGQKVLDAIDKLKKQEEKKTGGDSLSFSDEIMRQLMART